MYNLGEMVYFLGLEVEKTERGIFISQHKYAKEIFKKFHMRNYKEVSTPLMSNVKLCKDDRHDATNVNLYRSLIGWLLYLPTCRPAIMFSMSLLARFMLSPNIFILVL